MSRLHLETENRRTAFAPGDEVEVFAEWQLDEPPEAVEVRLVWYTRGKGDTDVSVVGHERFEHASPYESRSCRFTLPAAPYSFSGKNVSLIWALELVVSGTDKSERLDIVVAPDGREIDLYADETV